MPPANLAVYECQKCGWSDFHESKKCPRCQGEVGQTVVPGLGKIVTFTAIRYPPKGYESQAPYVVAIIKLENGPKVIGRVANPIDDVTVGSDVALASENVDTLEFRLSP